MAKTVYILAAGPLAAKTDAALHLINALTRQGDRVGIFRPLVTDVSDPVARQLIAAATLDQTLDDAVGVTVDTWLAGPDKALSELIVALGTLSARYDAVVVVGSDFTSPIAPIAAAVNARIAANLDAPVLALLDATGPAAQCVLDELSHAHADVLASLTCPLAGDTDWDGIAADLAAPRLHVRTPLRFEYDVAQAARADKQTIVLPESGDDRVLRAAAITLERGTADIVLLGEPDQVRADAARLGVDLSRAHVASMSDEEALTRYATAYAELRKAKGVTLDQAKAKLADPSYWGTMMVKLGEADAMVSGATHTTANTIRPAFEVIKAKPDAGIVSGAFFMCMADQVWLFADPAVNPNPTPADLASIAISSAESAAAFGITPRVAMLSYSTGTSGKGPDVDMVVEATALVHERRPDLAVDGPMQFDAAVDPTVAALKMPGSPVAGQATVFIFPDLDAGNIAYKAVQRTSGATAVGPILQGLNKTVTDLSRGALVDDIVSTIVITAVQAQSS
ncbi:MAG: phosphate acetyltransferase [Propionibacteriaceae bacterium]|nr:phosphate acetyltransferase [Propionibacteriaceae bacterium]